jgi:predicted acetyltransferase
MNSIEDTIICKRLSMKHAMKILPFMNDTFFDCSKSDDYWSQTEIANWLTKKEDYCIGAFLNNKIVGFCLTHYHKEANKVHLENIFVVSEFRRKGIALKMFNNVIDFYTKKYKIVRFVGLVNVENEATISFLSLNSFTLGDKMYWFQKNFG